MLTHKRAVVISGLIWIIMGLFLFYKGMSSMLAALKGLFSQSYEGFSLILWISSFVGDFRKGIVSLFFLCFFVGFIKGRFILRKTVRRVTRRILNQSTPLSFRTLYSRGYYFLIGGMALMGMGFKLLPIPLDVIGTVDLMIGSALINGAMLYFREALLLDNKPCLSSSNSGRKK